MILARLEMTNSEIADMGGALVPGLSELSNNPAPESWVSSSDL